MGDYERSTTVDLPVDDLFDYLSRVENLPKYMSRMTEAHSVTGDEVEVEAKLEPSDVQGTDADGSGGTSEATPDGGRTVRGEAWFRIDADGRRLEWGAEGPHEYHGELQVSGSGSSSTVVVRLHTLHDDSAAVEDGLDDTLENIRRLGRS